MRNAASGAKRSRVGPAAAALLLVVSAGLVAVPLASAAPGVNDAPTFSLFTGSSETDLGQAAEAGHRAFVRADGTILLSGERNSEFLLSSHRSDGSLDPGFGGGDGWLSTDIGSGASSAEDVAEQPDGKVVVVGHADQANRDFAVARYDAVGNLDLTFGGGDGYLTTDFAAGDDLATAVAIQGDGKLLVGGEVGNADADFGLARYNSDGTLDTSFGGGDGLVSISVGGDDSARDIAVQADGSILLAGYTAASAVTSDAEWEIIRLTSAGVLDTTFSGDGVLELDLGAGDGYGQRLALQADGKIIFAGHYLNGAQIDSAVVRLLTDGTLDAGFGSAGVATVDFSGFDDTLSGVAVRSDGKIVAAGTASNGSDGDFGAFRLDSNGTIDTGFGAGGTVTWNSGDPSQTVFGLNLQPDDKVVLSGVSGGPNYNPTLARITADGVLDSATFGPRSTLDASPGFTENSGTPVVLDAAVQITDEELTAADDFSGASLTLARSGAPDPQDLFGFVDGNGITLVGAELIKNTQSIAAFDTASVAGQLVVLFTNGNGETPTQADVDNILGQIEYQHTGDGPPATVIIDWTFDDGNTGTAQGSGPALSVTDSISVAMTTNNDPPSIMVNTGIPADEGGSVTITAAMLDEGDPDDDGTELTYTVSGGPSEGRLELTTGPGVAITNFTQDDIDNSRLVYVHTTASPTSDSFSVSLADGGEDGSTPAVAAVTVTVTGTNDAPILTGLDGGSTYIEGGAWAPIDADVTVTDEELTAADNFSGATLELIRSGGVNGDDVFVAEAAGTLGALTPGIYNLTLSSTIVGAVSVNSGGRLLLTFGSGATSARVNEVLQQIAYRNASDAPPSGVVLQWTFDDGNGVAQGTGGPRATVGTTPVTITATNDDPVVVVGLDVAFTEDGGPILVDPNGTVTDGDQVDFDGGTLTATISNYGTVNDRLTVRHSGSGSGQVGVVGTALSYEGVNIGSMAGGTDGATPLVITFNSNATETAVNAVHNSIEFDNVSDEPSTSARGLSFSVTDGDGGTSGPAAKAITVAKVNDAPVYTGLDGGSTHIEGGPAVVVDGDATVFDGELSGADNFDGATLAISRAGGQSTADGFEAVSGGTLGSLTPGIGSLLVGATSIGDVIVNSGGRLSLSFNANATNALVDQLLQQVGYLHIGDAPPPSVDLEWTFGDGTVTTVGSTTTLITATNDAPSVTLGPDVSFTENGGPIRIDPTGTITDPDLLDFDTGSIAVAVAAGATLNDRLTVPHIGNGLGQVGVVGTTVSYGGLTVGSMTGGTDGATPLVIIFNANADQAAVQTVYRHIEYDNPSEAPATAIRQLAVTVADGDGAAASSATKNLSLIVSNDQPTFIDLNGGSTYIEDGAPAVLDGDVTLDDPELSAADNFAGATLELTRAGAANPADEFVAAAGGTLGVLTPGSNNLVVGAIMVGSVTANDGGRLLITFGSNATEALVNQVIRQIAYRHSGEVLPISANIEWTFSDGSATATGTTPVTLLTSNDRPSIDLNGPLPGSGRAVTYTEGAAAIAVADSAAEIIDPDDLFFANLAITLTGFEDGEQELLTFDGQTFRSGISGTATTSRSSGATFLLSFDGATLQVTEQAGGIISRPDLQALLVTAAYRHTGTNPTPGDRTLAVTVEDGSGATAIPVNATISIAPVNDGPMLTTAAGATVTRGGRATIGAGQLRTTDPDHQPADLYYTVVAVPTFGRLELDTAPGVAISQFTQADIDGGRLVYVNDDLPADVNRAAAPSSDGFSFWVADAAGASTPSSTFDITIVDVAGSDDDPAVDDDPADSPAAPGDDTDIDTTSDDSSNSDPDDSSTGSDSGSDSDDPDTDLENHADPIGADTPIRPKAGVAVAMQLVSAIDTERGSYLLTYRTTVSNIGVSPLTNVMLTDDLATAFAGAKRWSVSALWSTRLSVNPSFDGRSDLRLLNGLDSLDAKETAEVMLTVRVTPSDNATIFHNSLIATADSSAGSPEASSHRDVSTDGADPDPTNDGDPLNDSEPTVADVGPNSETPASIVGPDGDSPQGGEGLAAGDVRGRPVAGDDLVRPDLIGIPVTIEVLDNDPGAIASSLEIWDPSAQEYSRSYLVPGEGRWTVDPAGGTIVFTPLPGFDGDPTPVEYRVWVESETGPTGYVGATAAIEYDLAPDELAYVDDGSVFPPLLPWALATLVLGVLLIMVGRRRQAADT